MKAWVNKHHILIAALLAGLLVDEIAADEIQAANTDEEPSMELLEFLGEWQTDDGNWFDPLNLLDIEPDEAVNAKKAGFEVTDKIEEQANE